jgi:hypothetical protein
MDQSGFENGKTVLRVVAKEKCPLGEVLFGVFAGYDERGALGLNCTEKFFWVNSGYIQSVEALDPRDIALLFRKTCELTRLVW